MPTDNTVPMKVLDKWAHRPDWMSDAEHKRSGQTRDEQREEIISAHMEAAIDRLAELRSLGRFPSSRGLDDFLSLYVASGTFQAAQEAFLGDG